LNSAAVAPEALAAMGATAKYVAHASISAKLRYLVELRVSQINGCTYCVDKHSEELRSVGETQQRIDCVVAWRHASFYTEQERAALGWAEAVTALGPAGVADDVYERVRSRFSEKELVDLTVIIAMMNAWNRLAVSFGKGPDARNANGR
jgi:uncharacterized peroxidase-related enzyme